MKNYAILINPGHNRVYFEQSKKLSLYELIIALDKMNIGCFDIKLELISDIAYIVFKSEFPLSDKNIAIISKLSFVYSIYERKNLNEQVCLVPIAKNYEFFMDDDLSTILKYSGKTNEIFTRMMINVALSSSDFDDDEKIKLYDPIAGKGTTLFEGLILGYDVYGTEIGPKVVSDTYHFLKKYLETKRLKHISNHMKFSGAAKDYATLKYTFDIAKSKQDMRDKKIKHCELVAANSACADKLFKKNFFNIIVGDLPYGVQHGNITNQKQSSMTRNPSELLAACLPAWKQVLKKGGTIVLAWNEHTLSKKDIDEIFNNAGFTILSSDTYDKFSHRVDNSILRNIVVAKKTR